MHSRPWLLVDKRDGRGEEGQPIMTQEGYISETFRTLLLTAILDLTPDLKCVLLDLLALKG